MKFFYFIIFVFVFLSFHFLAGATPDSSVMVAIVQENQIDRCRQVKAGTLPLYIKAVTWKSPSRAVGLVKEKDQNIEVGSQGRLEEVVLASLKAALIKCGFVLSPLPDNAIEVKVKINDFFVKSINEGFVGKTTGTADFTMELARPETATYLSSNHALEMDYKAGPSRKIKRLEKILNQILVDVLNDIAFSETLYTQTAQLSGQN